MVILEFFPILRNGLMGGEWLHGLRNGLMVEDGYIGNFSRYIFLLRNGLMGGWFLREMD